LYTIAVVAIRVSKKEGVSKFQIHDGANQDTRKKLFVIVVDFVLDIQHKYQCITAMAGLTMLRKKTSKASAKTAK
jgi:hypothetical protein